MPVVEGNASGGIDDGVDDGDGTGEKPVKDRKSMAPSGKSGCTTVITRPLEVTAMAATLLKRSPKGYVAENIGELSGLAPFSGTAYTVVPMAVYSAAPLAATTGALHMEVDSPAISNHLPQTVT